MLEALIHEMESLLGIERLSGRQSEAGCMSQTGDGNCWPNPFRQTQVSGPLRFIN